VRGLDQLSVVLRHAFGQLPPALASALFASGGIQPYTWSVVAGALPPGLALPKRENTISGTPTTAGTFTFTVRVTDDLDAFSEKELSITIS
jgi:Putative Ig domain